MAAILSRPQWDAMSNSISFHWSRDCLKRFSRLTTNIYQNSALLARYDQWISHTKGQVMRKVRPCHMQMMFMTALWLPTQINIAFSWGFLRSRMLCQNSTRHLFIRCFEMSKWDRFEKKRRRLDSSSTFRSKYNNWCHDTGTFVRSSWQEVCTAQCAVKPPM